METLLTEIPNEMKFCFLMTKLRDGIKSYEVLVNSYLQLLTTHMFSVQINWQQGDCYNEFSVGLE